MIVTKQNTKGFSATNHGEICTINERRESTEKTGAAVKSEAHIYMYGIMLGFCR
jgi:hypothetical protein